MNVKPQTSPPKREERDIMRRAAVAYLSDPKGGHWPDEVESGLEHDGQRLLYAVLRDGRAKVLACYRVRHDDKLMRVPPPEGMK